MAFDPFTNDEIMEILRPEMQEAENDKEALYQYYKLPIMCLLRIKDSIDLWEKNSGANGYFDFIEGYMGAEIQGDEMKFSVHCKGF